MFHRAFRRTAAALSAMTLGLTTACAFSDQDPDRSGAKTVVLITHDSWSMDKKVIAEFEKSSGYDVKVRPTGDAGALTNRLVLTKDEPLGDAVYGIDNTFASRASQAGVLARYTSTKLPKTAQSFRLPAESGGRELTPIDFGDVCINVDKAWFAKRKQAPPRTLADLTKKEHRDQLVVPGATSSSPGLSFLLATIAAEGDGWRDYWRDLVANGVKIDSGWTEAYENDFTASGKGDRPIVLSYASSIPFTVPEGGKEPATAALLDTCYRQVEYAGILKGAANEKGARELIDFMGTKRFQEALPENMYVFPADTSAALPPAWSKWAAPAKRPYSVAPDRVAAKRAGWLREWRDITSR